MNEKTQRQIEEMKKTTFGVEIEFNNITRKKAAEALARHFGTQAYYAAAEYGYMAWAVRDPQGRIWKIQRDVSIEGPDDQRCELVTPVLRYDDMELLQEAVRQLRHAGAKASASRGTGTHIHLGSDGHTPQTIRTLVNMMAAHENQLIKAIRIDRWRMSRYCRTVDPHFLERLNKQKPKTMEALAKCWYNGRIQHEHYSETRYRMLNLHSLFNRYHTIEFRLFQFDEPTEDRKGGLNAGQLKAQIQLCLAMNQLAKMIKFASPKPQQTENEAFAFRTFMCRLGMIGDEFKTARDYYMRNMEGNSAWRFGRP
ncbi:MAG: amidoligase family protein [Lachnospiraceae bacterium]|nr:amidoligase family protein [Lachnospiraceae bacterium]